MPTGVYIRIKGKRGLAKEMNPNWKGGITPVHFRIRNCDKNVEWKKNVLARDNYTCVLCGENKCDLHVDHFPITFSILLSNLIDEFGIENAFEKSQNHVSFWDINNGRTLCINCHKGSKHVIKRKKKEINLLTYNGETKTLVEWCKYLHIPHRTAFGRQQRGLSVEQILSAETLILKKDNIVNVTYNGETKPITKWCRELGLNPKLVRRRIREFGWNEIDALFHPNRQRMYNSNIAIRYIKKCKRSNRERGPYGKRKKAA